jgi:hypothetical protein
MQAHDLKSYIVMLLAAVCQPWWPGVGAQLTTCGGACATAPNIRTLCVPGFAANLSLSLLGMTGSVVFSW